MIQSKKVVLSRLYKKIEKFENVKKSLHENFNLKLGVVFTLNSGIKPIPDTHQETCRLAHDCDL